MNRNALFVFNGDPMCFIHVLLNALDMHEKQETVAVILEGASVKLLPNLADPSSPLHPLWKKALEAGIIDGACKACAQKLGTLADAETQNITLLADMKGHVGMAAYQEKGYTIITF